MLSQYYDTWSKADSHFKGNVLQSQTTKQFSCYVYQYPKIGDIEILSSTLRYSLPIIHKVDPLEVYLCGLLLFSAHVNDF